MRVYLVMRLADVGRAYALKCFSKYENAVAYEDQCKENDILGEFCIDTFNVQDMGDV